MGSRTIWIVAVAAALLSTLQLSAQTYYNACPAPPKGTIDQPYGLASDTQHIWIGCATQNVLTEINISNGALVRQISGLESPMNLVWDDVNNNIWVSSYELPVVWKIQVSSGKVLGTFTVGAAPRGITFDGTYVWVVSEGNMGAGSGSISKVLATTGAITTYPLSPSFGCQYPYGAAFDGTYIWVSCVGSNGTVIAVNSQGQQVDWDEWPYALGISFGGGGVWVGSGEVGNVDTLIEFTASGIYYLDNLFTSQDVAAAGTYVWVTSSSGPDQLDVKQIRASDRGLVATYNVSPSWCWEYSLNCIISDQQGNIWVSVLSTVGGKAPQVAKIPD